MPKRPEPRSPRLPAALFERLHEPMLSLHAAMEVESLWRAVQRVIRQAVPVHRITLFLGHLGMGEARLVMTDPPIADIEGWYAARGPSNPFSPWIASHRGARSYRFREVLPPREVFVSSEFYRRFAQPEGWDKGMSFLYWRKNDVVAMASLYRAPTQPEFSRREEAVIDYLYPFIGIAVERVQKLHNERLARRGLEEFNKKIPVGLIFLDWELNVEFANAEAQAECAVWNHGPAEARALNVREVFRVPPDVSAACLRLKEAVQARNPKQLLSLPGDVEQVVHRLLPGLKAQVSVLNNPGSALAKPRFLVVLDGRVSEEPAATVPLSGSRMGHLRGLSPREREIALLVCDGFSNAEIAQRLSKSILTIKTQLNSVFSKLGVNSRTKLMTLLR